MVKTGVTVVLYGDTSVTNVIKKTIKALRRANRNKDADKFQKEVCSGKRPFMEVVTEYVDIV